MNLNLLQLRSAVFPQMEGATAIADQYLSEKIVGGSVDALLIQPAQLPSGAGLDFGELYESAVITLTHVAGARSRKVVDRIKASEFRAIIKQLGGKLADGDGVVIPTGRYNLGHGDYLLLEVDLRALHSGVISDFGPATLEVYRLTVGQTIPEGLHMTYHALDISTSKIVSPGENLGKAFFIGKGLQRFTTHRAGETEVIEARVIRALHNVLNEDTLSGSDGEAVALFDVSGPEQFTGDSPAFTVEATSGRVVFIGASASGRRALISTATVVEEVASKMEKLSTEKPAVANALYASGQYVDPGTARRKAVELRAQAARIKE